jgi:putative sigma-54 modulation protein
LDIDVVLSVDKFRSRCEVTVQGEGLHINAGEQNPDMYAAIDLVSDKIESQIKKRVSKVKEQRRKAREKDIDVFTYTLEGEGDNQPKVVGTPRFATKPLYLDEALMQLEAIGSEFLVFFNAENGRINVIYRRRNAGYGLIDPVL